tara:strand:+ start:69 stop:383 length:315 start_codon:yes stop_codon:yes gene_type:complete
MSTAIEAKPMLIYKRVYKLLFIMLFFSSGLVSSEKFFNSEEELARACKLEVQRFCSVRGVYDSSLKRCTSEELTELSQVCRNAVEVGIDRNRPIKLPKIDSKIT